MSKHHAILDVMPGCGVEQLKARWRGLAAIHHPDRGGNSVEFSTIRNAYQAALKIEATEEAIYNSLCMSGSMSGFHGTVQGLPLDKIRALVAKPAQTS